MTAPALSMDVETTDRTPGAAKLRRKRLSRADQAEVARLYGQTETSAADIRQQFGIGDSTLYRIVQRNGLTLRGRVGSTARKPRTVRGAGRRTLARRPSERRRASPTARAAQRTPVAPPTPLSVPQNGHAGVHNGQAAARRKYRVRFDAWIEAADVADALRQAARLGASEVVAITQQD